MSTDRLNPELLRKDPKPALGVETAADTLIYLPLALDLHPMAPPAGDVSWLEVIRYWVDELRWWRKHWGNGSH